VSLRRWFGLSNLREFAPCLSVSSQRLGWSNLREFAPCLSVSSQRLGWSNLREFARKCLGFYSDTFSVRRYEDRNKIGGFVLRRWQMAVLVHDAICA